MNVYGVKVRILVLFLVLTTIGCGLLAGGSPERVARDWLEAGLKQDTDTLMRLTCSADRDAVMESGLYATLLGGVVGYFGINLEFDADLSELEFETIRQDKQSATVSIDGTLFVRINQMPIEVPLEDERLYLVKEDGKWRVCSSAAAGAYSSGASAPSRVDLGVSLPEGMYGFFVVSRGDLLPLRELESVTVDVTAFPRVRGSFPVVLLRSDEINITYLQLFHLIAGTGFEMQGTDRGVVVTYVQPGSPAEMMGLQAGDIILAVNGVEVGGDSSKVRRMIPTQFQQDVEMQVLRGTQTLSLKGRTDVIVDWEIVPFEFSTRGDHVQLFPREPLTNGLYCYGNPGVWGFASAWCFVVELP